jgi:formate hydrogenlyase subunit 4
MFNKPVFQEINDLVKISWRIWLLVGVTGSLLFWLAPNLWIRSQYTVIAFVIMGGLLPIVRFWGLIKSKNISTVRMIFFSYGCTNGHSVFISIRCDRPISLFANGWCPIASKS